MLTFGLTLALNNSMNEGFRILSRLIATLLNLLLTEMVEMISFKQTGKTDILTITKCIPQETKKKDK